MTEDTVAKERRDRKRAWRLAVHLSQEMDCCFNCKLYERLAGSLLGFCHKMAHDLGVPIIECSTPPLSECDEHIKQQ